MALRTLLYGKVLHHEQAARLLSAFQISCKGPALREMYEQQLIVESPTAGTSFTEALASPENFGLTTTDAASLRAQVQATSDQALRFLPEDSGFSSGFDSSAIPSAPEAPIASPSFPVLVMHSNGRVVTVLADPNSANVSNILEAAGKHLGAGQFNLAVHQAILVWPSRRYLDDTRMTLGSLGIQPMARILWFERSLPKDSQATPADTRTAGLRFQQIRSVFFGESQGQLTISRGELRNFLWNMNLEDSDFDRLWQRLDVRGHGFLDMEDLLHLVGRAHMRYPMVPIDALIYEAVVLIVRPTQQDGPSAHFDVDLTQAPAGLGCWGACKAHCVSYTTSFALQVMIIVFAGLSLASGDETFIGIAVSLYAVYLIHCFCCTRFSSAMGNRLTGLDVVCSAMEEPKKENPLYRWSCQNYHYETRIERETYTDSQGKTQTRTVSKSVRVNTGPCYTRHGVIPSTDETPTFIPNTKALVTEIDTELSLDFSNSNYLNCYRHWLYAHRWDLHQDESRTEWLPSQKTAILAEWVSGTRPCWMRRAWYVLSSLALVSCCFRLLGQMQCGRQQFTYKKRCYRISYEVPANPHVGAAQFIGGLLAGVEIASAISRGARVW